VVVDVRLARVLLVGLLVGLVRVGERGVVMLMVVGRRHVRPLLPMPEVVGHVRVLVLVHLGVVRVRLRQRAHLLPVAMVAHWQEYPESERVKQPR
jgi:hypothetical protein